MTNSNPDIPDFNPTQTYRQTMILNNISLGKLNYAIDGNKTMDNSKVTQ